MFAVTICTIHDCGIVLCVFIIETEFETLRKKGLEEIACLFGGLIVRVSINIMTWHKQRVYSMCLCMKWDFANEKDFYYSASVL